MFIFFLSSFNIIFRSKLIENWCGQRKVEGGRWNRAENLKNHHNSFQWNHSHIYQISETDFLDYNFILFLKYSRLQTNFEPKDQKKKNSNESFVLFRTVFIFTKITISRIQTHSIFIFRPLLHWKYLFEIYRAWTNNGEHRTFIEFHKLLEMNCFFFPTLASKSEPMDEVGY